MKWLWNDPRGAARRLGAALVVSAALASPIPAELPAPEEPQRAALIAIAQAKAATAALDAVLSFRIHPRLTIAGWSTRDEQIDRALRRWIRGLPPAQPPRVYHDGVCELELRVEPADLRSALLSINEHLPASSALPSAELSDAANEWTVRWFSGWSEPREVGEVEPPPGWADVSYAGQALARRAAIADACQHLLDAAGQVKVTSARRLADFLADGTAAHAAVLSGITSAAQLDVQFEPDQLVTVSARLDIVDLIRILNQARAAADSETFATQDFREIALLTGQRELLAGGVAGPPRALHLPADRPPPPDAPSWVLATLAARGAARSPSGATDRAALAEARAVALEELRGQARGLTVRRDLVVEDFLLADGGLSADFELFISGARERSQPRYATGRLEIDLELPLLRLAELLSARPDPPRVVAASRPVPAPPAEPPPTQTSPAAARPPTTPPAPASQPATQPTPRLGRSTTQPTALPRPAQPARPPAARQMPPARPAAPTSRPAQPGSRPSDDSDWELEP